MNESYNNQNNNNNQNFNRGAPEVKEIDRELAELIKKQAAKIKVIGIGGGGNNSLNRMREIGIKGGEMIAINTDAQDLLYANSDQKILIGRESTQGLGAGSNPKIGEEAARESEQEIKKKIAGSDMIFITCGMGGGTGTGAAPVIAGLAKKQGALTIGVVTMPFTIEGQKRVENAIMGLEKMESVTDTLIVDGGVSLIGMGESDTEHRAKDAVEKALTNPLLDVDISGAKGALVNVIGGPDMSLDECKEIISTIGGKLNPNAKMIWGAKISPDMEKSIRVLLIATGVKSNQILGNGESMENLKYSEMEDELDIEFIR